MEGSQGPNMVMIAQPLRSIDEYKIEVLQALRRRDSVKITGSDDAVPMAICVAQLVESTKKARKYFVDAWSTSSRSQGINQHSQRIAIYMERIQRRHPDPEDLDIVLNFSRNDGNFMEDVEDALDILSEKDSVILRGVNEGVFRAISVAQVLNDTGEAVNKSIQTSTDYRNYQTAKIEIEMEALTSFGVDIDPDGGPPPHMLRQGAKGHELGSSAVKELQKRLAYNCWKRWFRGDSRGASSSDSKKQYDNHSIFKDKGDVESPGPSSSNTEKQCEVPLVDKSTGNVESPGASSSDTEKQCEASLVDRSKAGVESPGASSSDNEKQSDTPSIDKSKGDVESPGASSSDNKKQCDASSIDKSKRDIESPGTSSSDTEKQCDTSSNDKSRGMTKSSTEMHKNDATNPLQISTIDVNTIGRCV